MLQRTFIPIVAFFSGVSGLAYEIIYLRLVSYYVGDLAWVIAATLIAVFLGLAAGYWLSGRLLRSLWVIQLFLGFYAFLVTYLFSFHGVDFIALFGHSSVLVVFATLFIFFPMFFVGFSIPALSEYASLLHRKQSFAEVYGLYTLGAGIFVLLLESILWVVGIAGTLVIAGLLNSILAFCFYKFIRHHAVENTHSSMVWNSKLFFFGSISAIFQFYYLLFVFNLFEPHVFSFSAVLAAALIGIAIGTYLSARYQPALSRFVVVATYIAFLPFLFLPFIISLYLHLFNLFESEGIVEYLLKTVFSVGIGLPFFILFGAVVPLAIHSGGRKSITGILFSNAIGNAIGILVATFLLFPFFQFPAVLAGILLFLFLLVHTVGKKLFTHLLLSLSLLTILFFLWPTEELYVGAKHLTSIDPSMISEELTTTSLSTRIRSVGNEAILYTIDTVDDTGPITVLNLMGLRSISFFEGSPTEWQETILGVSPALYSKKHSHALVIGLGAGFTTSGAMNVFREVKVFEINPAMLQIADHFSELNGDVLKRTDVSVVLQDGFVGTLLEDNGKYDAIINTTSGPFFYSAGKLFTKEFFEIVHQKLAEGGVYGIWYDLRYNDKDILILWTTLLEVFDECSLQYLNEYYHYILCGEELHQRHSASDVFTESTTSKAYLEDATLLEIPIDMQEYVHTLPQLRSNSLNHLRIITQRNRNTYSFHSQDLFNDLIQSMIVKVEENPRLCRIPTLQQSICYSLDIEYQ